MAGLHVMQLVLEILGHLGLPGLQGFLGLVLNPSLMGLQGRLSLGGHRGLVVEQFLVGTLLHGSFPLNLLLLESFVSLLGRHDLGRSNLLGECCLGPAHELLLSCSTYRLLVLNIARVLARLMQQCSVSVRCRMLDRHGGLLQLGPEFVFRGTEGRHRSRNRCVGDPGRDPRRRSVVVQKSLGRWGGCHSYLWNTRGPKQLIKQLGCFLGLYCWHGQLGGLRENRNQQWHRGRWRTRCPRHC